MSSRCFAATDRRKVSPELRLIGRFGVPLAFSAWRIALFEREERKVKDSESTWKHPSPPSDWRDRRGVFAD
jgi:hypothetical protein